MMMWTRVVTAKTQSGTLLGCTSQVKWTELPRVDGMTGGGIRKMEPRTNFYALSVWLAGWLVGFVLLQQQG